MPGWYIRNTFSKLTSTMSATAKISTIWMTGRMLGSVIDSACCQRLAPSITADSYSSGLTPASAAR